MTSDQPARRRIDQVLDPDFMEGVESLELEDLRKKRGIARDVENELSYYRRLLHGRLDLVHFELRRRRGEESRSLIEALPQILADDTRVASSRGRHIQTDLPPLPDVGRREVDFVLGDDVLTRLDEVDEGDLEEAGRAIDSLASEISDQRHRVQQVEDVLARLISDRYRSERPVGS